MLVCPPPHPSPSVESKQTAGEAWSQVPAQTPSQHWPPEQGGLAAAPSAPAFKGAAQSRRPMLETGTTQPPYIGDAYMSDEIPPQTVSLPDGQRNTCPLGP